MTAVEAVGDPQDRGDGADARLRDVVEEVEYDVDARLLARAHAAFACSSKRALLDEHGDLLPRSAARIRAFTMGLSPAVR